MLKKILLPCLALLLSACATLPEKAITDESHQLWQQHQQQLRPLLSWHIRGRVALFVNNEVYNLGMSWSRNDQHHSIKLEAALGQGVILLKKTPVHAELTTIEGETYTGTNAQQLLQQVTQLTLPVEGLQSWIKGLALENSSFVPDIDAEGRLITLQQDGWQINYFDYQRTDFSAGQQYELPHKLYLKRDNLALKIVIDQWTTQQAVESSPLFSDFPE